MEWSLDLLLVLGTWFSGIIAALAIVFSVWASNRKYTYRIEMDLDCRSSGINLALINHSEIPITVNKVGIYLSGRFHSIALIPSKLIQPNESIEVNINEYHIHKIIELTIFDGNWCANSHRINYKKMQKELETDEYSVFNTDYLSYYHFKFAVCCPGTVLVNKKWINIFSLPYRTEKNGLDGSYVLFKPHKVLVKQSIFLFCLLYTVCFMSLYVFDSLLISILSLFSTLIIQEIYIYSRITEGNLNKYACRTSVLVVCISIILFMKSISVLTFGELLFTSILIVLFVGSALYNTWIESAGLNPKNDSLTLLDYILYINNQKEQKKD